MLGKKITVTVAQPEVQLDVYKRQGIEGAVPIRVTAKLDTTLAKAQASSRFFPSERAVTRPPLKASPAPVESTTFTS